MNLQTLQRLNPDYSIKSIKDKSFQTFGKIIDEDVSDVIAYVSTNVHPPKLGNRYQPSVPAVEQFSSVQKISQKVYGYMEVMAGVVSGHNHVFNGIEYHQGSETIIAVSDYILVVGHLWEMKDKTYDSSLCQIFYVPQGTIVECYSTTLHYTPICVSDEGFKTICMLLRGTGDTITRNDILKKKNKWFIAHVQNEEKIQSGDFPGFIGKMIDIKYK
ncbi:DUF4867 family protein [Candidatus Stoquefichus massiliensis]|uniref:DUF4867 family protein n=1 Tax=Candidatus Stoquefichus massiliensis TaxID=1470350 RepID=UPI00048443A2|nr:DUF4867 family protein [Candidatus Stoquefichus massiliensis]